ncbi:MAG: MarC family protein [Sedimentisphaerales bacterium]|nr:MarC family protein [Sedimentisphaerales bacterium]
MSLLEAIIALFVIVDPIGNIPVFLSVTSGIPQEKRQRAYTISVAVAMGILLLFSFTGDVVLHKIFGIQIADLQIAGGILLVIMAIGDLVFGSHRRPKADETLSADEVGCVPLGCPLLAGPGAIVTTLMIWKNPQQGPWAAVIAVGVVLILFRVLMYYVEQINQLVGRLVITAVSKVMLVFLAAIGVRMLMLGLEAYFPAH